MKNEEVVEWKEIKSDAAAHTFEQAVANMGPKSLKTFTDALTSSNSEAAELLLSYRSGKGITADDIGKILNAIKKDSELLRKFTLLDPKLEDFFRRDGEPVFMGTENPMPPNGVGNAEIAKRGLQHHYAFDATSTLPNGGLSEDLVKRGIRNDLQLNQPPK